MPDYSEGKIYKLVSDQTEDVYIGSTCRTLNQRFSKHKTKFNHPDKYARTADMILKYDDCRIELVESFPCDEKYELLQRESYHIKHESNCINKNIPGRTRAEYMSNHNLHPTHCECGALVTKRNVARHKKTKKHIEFKNNQ